MSTPPLPHRLRLHLVKPSKYDDDGRVMSFWRGILPSNTLSVLAALARGWNDHRPAGIATRVETRLWDELVHGAVGPEFLAELERERAEPGVKSAVFVCGAQTNEYFRGRDIALWVRRQGFDVAIGGFHISGHKSSRDFLQANGVTTVVGEAEGQIAIILEDLIRGRLQPGYELMSGIRAKTGKDPIWVPDIVDAPLPLVDREYLSHFMNPTMTTLDTSRGCPFTCSYCSVKNVMGRTMRSRDPERVRHWLRTAHDAGIRYLFLVDDDFYRNPRWEEILEVFIEASREGRPLPFMMQVDVEASGGLARQGGEREGKARRFLDLAAEAGCYQVFVGFESFNPANLQAASKSQNRTLHQPRDEEEARAQIVEGYRKVVANWHSVGVAVHGAGMIGFPWDGPDAGRRTAQDFIDIRLDQASFFIVTPLPGTEDWDQALAERQVFDFDFDHYETTRPVTHHPLMSSAELLQAYRDAVHTFYSPARLATYLATNGWNRMLSAEARRNNVRQFLWYFFSRVRDRHPMIGGFWRRRGGEVKAPMSPRLLPAASTASPFEAVLAEVRAWRLEAAGATREHLAQLSQRLSQAMSGALAHLKHEPVVEDHRGVRPHAYLAPRLEAIAAELAELRAAAEQSLSRARIGALHEAVRVHFQHLWADFQRFGATVPAGFEELLREWRALPLATPSDPTPGG